MKAVLVNILAGISVRYDLIADEITDATEQAGIYLPGKADIISRSGSLTYNAVKQMTVGVELGQSIDRTTYFYLKLRLNKKLFISSI